jgi:hemoglobin-like flavoprotein
MTGIMVATVLLGDNKIMKQRKKSWDEKVLVVQGSFERIKNEGDFPAIFYQNLFFLKPQLKEYFKKTDFEHQDKALMHGMEVLMGFLGERKGHPRQQLLRLSHSHSNQGLNIHPHDYYYWIEAMIMTVKEFDPYWYTDMAYYWREVLFFPISFMISQYFTPPEH